MSLDAGKSLFRRTTSRHPPIVTGPAALRYTIRENIGREVDGTGISPVAPCPQHEEGDAKHSNPTGGLPDSFPRIRRCWRRILRQRCRDIMSVGGSPACPGWGSLPRRRLPCGQSQADHGCIWRSRWSAPHTRCKAGGKQDDAGKHRHRHGMVPGKAAAGSRAQSIGKKIMSGGRNRIPTADFFPKYCALAHAGLPATTE